MNKTVQTTPPFPTKLLLICLVVYLISFALPAYNFNYSGEKNTTFGYEAFFMGATAIIGGGTFEWLIWFADPLFFISILKRRNQKDTAITFALLASLISSSFLFWKEILASESGSTAPIESKGLGYFLWVSGIVIWTAGICVEDLKKRTTNRIDE